MNFKLRQILKDKLKEKEMKIQTLSKHTGISRKTIENWVDGQKPKNIEQVKVVADFFNMSLDELCFGEKPRENVSVSTGNAKDLEKYKSEILTGVFEVTLRAVKIKNGIVE